MTRRIPKLVPWKSESEWKQVHSWLYSSDFAERLKGVNRVKAWMSRGKVPLSVESTATLIEISLRDVWSASGQPAASHLPVSQKELRMLYTIAIVRFVNGIADQAQKGVYAKSIANLAEQMGLPTWFVDLRHAGTHEHLPSLAVLRTGCNQILSWLSDNYWDLQPNYAGELKAELQKLLVQYKNIMKGRKHGRSKKTKKASSNDTYTTDQILNEIVELITPDVIVELFIPLLLDIGLLVPASKKKRPVQIDSQLSQELASIWTPLLRCFILRYEEQFYEELLFTMLERIISFQTVDNISKVSEVEAKLFPFTSKFSTPISSNLGEGGQGSPDASDTQLKGGFTSSYILTLVAWVKFFAQKLCHPAGQEVDSKSVNEDAPLAAVKFPYDEIILTCLKNRGYFIDSILSFILHHTDCTKPLHSEFDSWSASFKGFITTHTLALADASPPSSPVSTIEIDLVGAERRMQAIRSYIADRNTAFFPDINTDAASSRVSVNDRWSPITREDWDSSGITPIGIYPALSTSATALNTSISSSIDLSLPVELNSWMTFKNFYESAHLFNKSEKRNHSHSQNPKKRSFDTSEFHPSAEFKRAKSVRTKNDVGSENTVTVGAGRGVKSSKLISLRDRVKLF
ncbi:Las1-like-domain-containing protein [Paraphysoderma sedebokerense]|nr:Las1-like-domain-containing protein [Paraphysoderma sedebokerense]